MGSRSFPAKLRRSLLIAALLPAGCLVSTETVPGETGPQGDPGPKGDSPWTVQSDGIYYADPSTGEKLASILNNYPAVLSDSASTVVLGGQLPAAKPGSFVKLGFGRVDDGSSYGAIGVRSDGTQGSMVLGVAGAPGDGANWEALKIGKFGVVETTSNLVVHGSFALTGTDGDGGAYFYSSQATGNNDIGFYTGSSSSERLTITADGNVGIGTVTPVSMLTVSGDARAIRFKVDAATFVSTSNAASGGEDLGVYTNGVERLSISDKGNVVIYPSDSGFDLKVAGNLDAGAYYVNTNVCMMNCPSDARLKRNILPLAHALDDLLRLRGVTYNWQEPEKHGGASGPQVGFVAQDVEKIFPEWVGSNKEGYKTLMIHGFEALAVESFRALKARNDKLEERLVDLTDRLNSERIARERLEARLAALEAKIK